MAISGSSLAQFAIQDTEVVGVETVARNPRLRHQVNWSDGEGASAVEDLASKVVATTTSSPVSLDLTSGFANLNGAAIAFTTLKAFMAFAPADNVGNISLSFGGANEWDSAIDGTVILKPGTSILIQTANASGYAVTNSTKDLVTIDGTTGDEVQIAVAGTS